MNFLTHFLESFKGLFGSSPNNSPRTLPGKCLVIAMAVFYMVFCCSQIGNLTAQFTSHVFKDWCNTFDCIIKNNKKVQISKILQSNIENLHPTLKVKNLIKNIDHFRDLQANEELPADGQLKEVFIGFLALLNDEVDAYIISHNKVRDAELIMSDMDKYWQKFMDNHKFWYK